MSTRGLTPETSSFDDSSFTPVPTNPKTPVKAKPQPKAKAGKTTADDIVASSKTGPIMILCEIAFAQDKKLEVNWARIAQKGGYKGPKSARDTWGQLKKKLYKEHGPEGEDMGVDGDEDDNPVPAKAAKRKAPNDGNEKTKKRTRPSKPKVEVEDEDDQE